MGLAESYRFNGSAPGVDGLDKLYPGAPLHTCTGKQHWQSTAQCLWLPAPGPSDVPRHREACCCMQAVPLTRWSLPPTRTPWPSSR